MSSMSEKHFINNLGFNHSHLKCNTMWCFKGYYYINLVNWGGLNSYTVFINFLVSIFFMRKCKNWVLMADFQHLMLKMTIVFCNSISCFYMFVTVPVFVAQAGCWLLLFLSDTDPLTHAVWIQKHKEESLENKQEPFGQTSLFCLPLFHFLLHINALLFQQLSLGKGPVHGLRRALRTLGLLSLSPGLRRMVEAEHVVFPQDNPITFTRLKNITKDKNIQT